MSDERVTGSVAETEDAIRKVPSLALTLFPRPKLLVTGDSWCASGGSSDGMGSNVQIAVVPGKDSTGGR